ncbi:MAG: hypothetical protein V3U98_09175 [Acidobacteriota bacterium]
MEIIRFPHRARRERGTAAPQAFDLVQKMIRSRAQHKSVEIEKRRLLESMGRLERLAQELEAIQVDLERLRAAFRNRRKP